jgi:PAS domain S-box-containing protein
MASVEDFQLQAPTLTEFDVLATADATVLDAIPGAVYMCDDEGRLVRYNSEAASLWGREPALGSLQERFCGSHALFHADGTPLPHAECPMARAVRAGTITRCEELVIERPDGTRITALANTRPLKDRQGRIRGAINCLQDITQRKAIQATIRCQQQTLHQTASALRENERHMRELLEALPAAVYTTDAEGRITFFNRAAVDFAGRTPELGSDSWCVTWRLYRSDGTPMRHEDCPMAVALREQRIIRGAEAIAERPDGTRIPFIPFPTPLFDSEGTLVGAINMLVDITDRKRAEVHQKTLIDELNHRVKNTLATVQSLAIHTAKHASGTADFVDTFEARLMALARAHNLLTKHQWQGALLRNVVEEILAPFADSTDRMQVEGAAVELTPRAALSFAMAVNELATNAAKYGALSLPTGSVSVNWTVLHENDECKIELDWSERGGPGVATPARRGFGMKLIALCMERDLGGDIDLQFEPAGLHCHMRFAVPQQQNLWAT